MNLTDFSITNLHHVYEECERDAHELRVALCGSQIVGLVPLESILMSADYFIRKENLIVLEEDKKVKLVVQKLGLNSVFSFDPKERIIEYILRERLTSDDENRYRTMSIKKFVDSLGARSSLPGGGCVSALVASFGSALACMCSLLTYGNKKYEELDEEMRELIPQFHQAYNDLMQLLDQDAIAFNAYVVS